MYKLLLVLHILTVVVGIGSVMLNAVYGREARLRPGPGGLAITEANQFVGKVAEYVIYLIPVTGILLVLSSEDLWEFSQTWIWLSLVLYFIAIGISHGVMGPTVKKMIGLMREMNEGPPPVGGPPPQAAQMEALGKRLATFGPVLNLIAIVLIALMVWKPGSPLG